MGIFKEYVGNASSHAGMMCLPHWLLGRTAALLPFSAASLIGVEGGNATRIGRFANYLRNLLPSNDPVVMEMASKAIGRLAMAGDTFTAEYVEFEVKRALEWLGADRNEGRRHAAVSDAFFVVMG